jgi:anti-anti-sigma factor
MALTLEWHEPRPRVVLLVCRGRVDPIAAVALRRELRDLCDSDAQRVIVHLGDVERLDAAGVAAIAGAGAALRRRGAELSIVPPMGFDAGRILHYSGLAPLFPA